MATYSAYTDQELMALFKQGNQYVYTELYDRYKTLLYVFALRRIDDSEEAEMEWGRVVVFENLLVK